MQSPSGCLVKHIIRYAYKFVKYRNEVISTAYIKKKKNGSYLITVSCRHDSQDKKITRSTTFRPELFTAKGHPKTENTILKEVTAFAASFEKKVLAGDYTDGASMTFEEYSHRYLEEYAQISRRRGRSRAQRPQ